MLVYAECLGSWMQVLGKPQQIAQNTAHYSAVTFISVTNSENRKRRSRLEWSSLRCVKAYPLEPSLNAIKLAYMQLAIVERICVSVPTVFVTRL